MALANPIELDGLTTREAVADAFFRIMSGFDENDPVLLQSAMSQDIVLSINDNEISGFDSVKKASFDTVGQMDTTHFITNVRIDVKNNTALTARMTANTLAQHYPAGMGTTESTKRLLGGSKHVLQLERNDPERLWKVKRWIMKTIWHEGDPSILKLSHP